MSIIVRSKTTGQVLFTISELKGEVSVSPLEARRLLATLEDSAIGHFTRITVSDSRNSALIACMFGVTAPLHSDADLEPMNFHPQIHKRVII